jgi:hypothetical protein
MQASIRVGNLVGVGLIKNESRDSYVVLIGESAVEVSKKFVLKTTESVPESTEVALAPTSLDLRWDTRQAVKEALEANRGRLKYLGVVDSKKPVVGSTGFVKKPFHAYMKKDPFRDISKLHEGTPIEITDYYRGCAVIEADGEEFYIPVEPLSTIETKNKDDQYYFSLDMDKDNIPDPLVALPSKTALNQDRSCPDNNWNAQPELRKVAGNLSALPNIDMDDVSIIRGSYTSNVYYTEYLPDRLEDPTPSTVASEIVKKENASSECLFFESGTWEEFAEAYKQEFSKMFPGLTPDMEHLYRLFHGL